MTAEAWASTVSHRSYVSRRHELDAFLVAMDPAYERLVTAELERFEAVVGKTIDREVERDRDPETGRPPRPRLRLTLFWVFVLCITAGFGVMVPAGGGSSADFPDSWWQHGVLLASVLFVVGVGVQLVRGAPLRRRTPPVKDLSWLPTVLGVPTVAVMVVRVSQDLGVDPLWVMLTALAVAVSCVYCLVRWAQRRRDPRLTRQVDASENDRLRALRDAVHRHADESAQRITRGYAALPDTDRDRIAASLDAARATLRRRGILRELSPGEVRAAARGAATHRRPMVPGLLLLAQKTRHVWHPRLSVPGRPPAVQWLVGEMEPEPPLRRRNRVRAGA